MNHSPTTRNQPAPALKARRAASGPAWAWSTALAGLLLLTVHSAPAQVYSMRAGDIVAANFREGGNTVVRVNPQTGAFRRLGTFASPTDATISPDGYLYVSEMSGLIHRVNLTNGVRTTVNPGTTLSQVWGLAVGPDGDLFVTSTVSNRIVRIKPTTGAETNVVLGGQLLSPRGIDFLDPEHLVVASRGNDRVVSVSLLDQTQTVLARGADGMNLPWGISVFATNIYVAAQDSSLLFRITGTTVTNILPTWSPKLGGIPYGIGTDTNGNIVVGVSGGLLGPYALEQRDPQGYPLPAFSGKYIGEATGVEVSRISVLAESQVNTPPQLAAPGELVIDEGVAMSFSMEASDSDWPLQELTFSLVGNVTPGAGVTTSGVFFWQPTELQGPSTNTFSVVVGDDGVPSMSATQTLTVVVREVNTAPVVTPPGTRNVTIGTTLSFDITATDADRPDQTLSFSLEADAPAGTTITTNGGFSWSPGTDQPPGDYSVGVIVTDNGSPPLAGTNRFTVQVRAGNVAPVFTGLTSRTVDEGSLLSFQIVATDSNQPPQTLTYGLAAAAPPGVAVSASGLFTWTPTEAQGPITTNIALRVTDNGTPPMSTTGSVTVIVNEVNRAPTLNAITNRTLYLGEAVAFTAQAQDADLPAQDLTFSLQSGAPEGATILPTGEFSWAPLLTQTPSSNVITVIATDNGSPPLSNSTSFVVEVRGGYTLNEGDILVADFDGNAVVRLDAKTGAPQTLGTFLQPTDVALATNGFLYVSENGGTVERLDLHSGRISLVNTNQALGNLRSIVLGPAGELFVASTSNDRIVRLDSTNGAATTVTQGDLISGPFGIAMLDSNHLVVSSFFNDSLVVVALTNNTQYLLAQGNGLAQPWGIAASGGQVWVASYGAASIQTVADGIATDLVPLADQPSGLALAPNGDLVVSVGAVSEVACYSAAGSFHTNYQSGLVGMCMGVEVVPALAPVNHPPVAGPDTVHRDPAGGVKVSVATLLSNDWDAEGDLIRFVGASAASSNGGTVVSNGGWLHYTPAVGFTNADTFTYTISDGVNAAVTGIVTVAVRLDNGPAPSLRISHLGNGSYSIQGDGIPDRTYWIEVANDPQQVHWQPLGPATADPFGVFVLLDTSAAPHRFYRSVYPQP